MFIKMVKIMALLMVMTAPDLVCMIRRNNQQEKVATESVCATTNDVLYQICTSKKKHQRKTTATLDSAIKKDNLTKVQKIIQSHHPDELIIEKTGFNPLQKAIFSEKKDVVDFLLKETLFGNSLFLNNQVEGEYWSPWLQLMYRDEVDALDLMKKFLLAGANIDSRDREYRGTMLWNVAYRPTYDKDVVLSLYEPHAIEISNFLIRCGAEIDFSCITAAEESNMLNLVDCLKRALNEDLMLFERYEQEEDSDIKKILYIKILDSTSPELLRQWMKFYGSKKRDLEGEAIKQLASVGHMDRMITLLREGFYCEQKDLKWIITKYYDYYTGRAVAFGQKGKRQQEIKLIMTAYAYNLQTAHMKTALVASPFSDVDIFCNR